MGIVLQKSKLCYASMLSDLFAFRALSRNGKGILIATGITMLGWSSIVALRGPAGLWLPGWGWYGIVGGAIFGLGMVVSGCCMMSAIYRAGSGHMQYLLTLVCSGIGYFLYGLFYPRFVSDYFTPLWRGEGGTLFLATPIPGPVLVAVLLAVAILAYAWIAGGSRRRQYKTVVADGGTATAPKPDNRLAAGVGDLVDSSKQYVSRRRRVSVRNALTSPWDPRSGGIALAVLVIIWFAISGVWTVSGPEAGWVARLADTVGIQTTALNRWEFALFSGTEGWATPNMLVLAGIGLGSIPAALAADEFAIRWPRREVVPYAAGGGLLLGIGASLTPGCNIGNMFTGIAQLSLHGFVASLGMILGAYVGTKLLFS